MGLRRCQETLEEAYLGVRHYMGPKRVAAYVAFGALFIFGVFAAAIVWLATGWKAFEMADVAVIEGMTALDSMLLKNAYANGAYLSAVFGTFLPFWVISVAGFVFLGTTQETSRRYGIAAKRSAFYTIGAALAAFGVSVFPIVYHGAPGVDGIIGALACLLPFTLAGAAIIVFLALTEKPRLKPWAYKEWTFPYEGSSSST
jgi:hypothetical protein